MPRWDALRYVDLAARVGGKSQKSAYAEEQRMAVVIGLAVASFAAIGLAIFLFRYRGTRAQAAGVSAFALGVLVTVAFTLIHATVGPDHSLAQIAFFVSHVVMCMVQLLLLGAVVSMRDPSTTAYRTIEKAVGLFLSVLAVFFYGGVAWWRPEEQDAVARFVFFATPLLFGVAIVARFGLARDGLVGGGVFLALMISNGIYMFMNLFEQERAVLRAVADFLQMAGYLGMLGFFYLAAQNMDLIRSPWPGGSLRFNAARVGSAALLVLGIVGCGYFSFALREQGGPASWSSTYGRWLPLVCAASFAGCLLGVYGLTTGRNLLARRRKTKRRMAD
jgi:hypothetical protein